MATAFPDVPAWPDADQLSSGRDARHDNAPPLEERVMMEFVEELERDGITARVSELLDSAGRVPPIDSDTIAGKVGDLCKMAADVSKRIESAREKHNRPLLNAQRSLKARADAVFAPLAVAISGLRTSLNNYMAEQARKAAEERRKAEEEARRLQEEQAKRAAEAAERNEPPPPPPVIEPAKVEAPVARGDLGARVGTRTVWKHEIEVPIAKLPKAVLENERVRAAVDQVIGQMIRSGTKEIKGVRIWSEQEASVR